VDIGGVDVARTPWKRLVGLMGRRSVAGVQLLFPRCTSIHTCFMRVPIDVIFLDRSSKVVRIAPDVRPWRLVFGGAGAESVLEATTGFAAERQLAVGDKLVWRCD